MAFLGDVRVDGRHGHLPVPLDGAAGCVAPVHGCRARVHLRQRGGGVQEGGADKKAISTEGSVCSSCSATARQWFYAGRSVLNAATPLGTWIVLPAQLLHGITFGLFWSVGTAFAQKIAPEGATSSVMGVFGGATRAGASWDRARRRGPETRRRRSVRGDRGDELRVRVPGVRRAHDPGARGAEAVAEPREPREPRGETEQRRRGSKKFSVFRKALTRSAGYRPVAASDREMGVSPTASVAAETRA